MTRLIDLYTSHTGKVSDQWSSYLSTYDDWFRPYTNRPLRILEIGIQNGGSLEIWAKYFPNASLIVGCDINPLCAELSYDDAHIKVVVGDANTDDIRARIMAFSDTYDIIIDDGSHVSRDIVVSFAKYFPLLAEGGIYVAEDLHCSYWENFEGGIEAPYASVNFFKRLCDLVNYEHWGAAVSADAVLSYYKTTYDIDFATADLEKIIELRFVNSMTAVSKGGMQDNALGPRLIAGQVDTVHQGVRKLHGSLTSAPDQSANPQGPHVIRSENRIDPDQMQAQIAQQTAELAQKLDNAQDSLARSQKDTDQQIADLKDSLTKSQNNTDQRVQQVADLQDQLDRATLTAQRLELQVDQLCETLVMLKRRPLRAVRQKVIYMTLRSLIKLDSILPARTIERFKRSADKRNPRRKDYQIGPVAHVETPPAVQPTSEYQIVLNHWAEQRQKQTGLLHDLNAQLDGFVRFSVVVPVYNPDIPYLDAMIQSVQTQSYPNWELCIADDLSRPEVRDFLTEKAAQDSRIRLVLRNENGHISRATNSAIDVATGDFIVLLDHDDLLDPDALLMIAAAIAENPTAQILYTDEDKVRMDGERYDPHFKPDWNRDLLYGLNYVSHLGVYATPLVKQIDGFRVGFEGAQDYDLLLRCIEQLDDTQIVHIPKVLYSWRASPGSTAESNASKPYATLAGVRALSEHLERVHGRPIDVVEGPFPFSYRVLWPLDTTPLVSIVIPTRDKLHLTRVAVDSILAKTSYPNLEIIIVDNASIEPDTLAWFAHIQSTDSRVRVLRDDRPFNYSELNNAAVAQARGDVIALLNNDVEVINSDWLSEMVSLAIRPGTGCVGAKLYYPDGRIQHAGVVIGMGGVAGHGHLFFPGYHGGYFGRLLVRQSYSAVTAACLVVRRDIYDAVGGLNENDLKVAFNDVDLCLKVRSAGYNNVWTPWAELTHYESASRGQDDTPEKAARFKEEVSFMMKRWFADDSSDPSYNLNLTLDRQDFSFAQPQWKITPPRRTT